LLLGNKHVNDTVGFGLGPTFFILTAKFSALQCP
jgi:hypothetical protein